MSKYLPEGYTDEKIEEIEDFQRRNGMYYDRELGWVKEEKQS